MSMKLFRNQIAAIVALFSMLLPAGVLTSCSDDDPYFTATEDDAPRILNTDLVYDGSPLSLNGKATENFKYNVIVTPANYTTVTWFLDGEQIHEGDSIDQPILAGVYNLKIVATTTKGKSTSRTVTLTITPGDNDPVLGTKSYERWVAPGATATIHDCRNISDITGVLIGSQAAMDVTANGTTLKFTAPANLADSTYRIVLVDKDGKQYGGGKIQVTTTPPAEMTLWEGHHYVSWDLPDGDAHKTFNLLGKDVFATMKAGTVLKINYSLNTADSYHQLQVMTGWWTVLPGTSVQTLTADGSIEVTLTQEDIDLISAQDGFLIGGHGFYVDRIIEE